MILKKPSKNKITLPIAGGGKGTHEVELPAQAGQRRDALPFAKRTIGRLAGRHPIDHPRGGLLLRPAGPNENHERRMYTREGFEAAFSEWFETLESSPIRGSDRVLYLLKRRDVLAQLEAR